MEEQLDRVQGPISPRELFGTAIQRMYEIVVNLNPENPRDAEFMVRYGIRSASPPVVRGRNDKQTDSEDKVA